jgi:hypothetical protein
MSRIILTIVSALIVVGHPVGATIIVPPGTTTVPCDFVTGGGFIVGKGSPTSSLPAGVKANFAVGGGVKNGAFWGHLEYVDHSTSPPMQVHGTGVTGYFFPDPLDPSKPNERVIMGNARINGVDSYTYTVDVNDVTEPGKGVDQFSITLSNGYKAGFDFGDGPIAGGNIQLHPHHPSNTPPSGFNCG